MENTKSSMHKLSQCKREIELVIPAARVQEELKRTIQSFANRAKVKGFRPGKAPINIVKQMYAQDIKDTLINALVPGAVNKELQALNVKPVGSPVVTDLSYQEGHPITFKAQFEVWPEFELPEYQKIEVKKKKISVTDEDVNKSLEDLQTRSAQYVLTDNRGVIEGDYVVTEIQSQDINTKKAFPKEKVVILAGHPENEIKLNEQLLGMEVNEEKQFSVKYPEDHKNEKLAGKNMSYSMKVLSIKEKKLPEINDDFAKELGEFNNLKDLRAKLKSELHNSKENAAQRELSDEIVKKIAEKVTFELPESLVEQESLALVKRNLSSQTQQLQQALTKEDVTKLKEQMRGQAEENLKNHLILTKIAENENLTVTDTDVNEEIKNIARVNNIPLAEVQQSVDTEDVRSKLLLRKTVDFLVENVIMENT